MQHALAITVFAVIATALLVFQIIKSLRVAAERFQHGIAAALPVFALEHDQKIIATNMTDEVVLRITKLAQRTPGQLDHVITLAIAIDIVEGFEMIEIAVT